jgi:hypothetical protein
MSVAVNARGFPDTIPNHTPAPTPALCCAAHAAAPSNSESSVVAALVGQLTEQELDMTVGDYIEANLKRQVKELRQHMKQNVAEFEEQSRKARKALRDIAMQRVAATSNDDLVEEEVLVQWWKEPKAKDVSKEDQAKIREVCKAYITWLQEAETESD